MKPYLIRYFLLLGLPVEIDILAQSIFAVLTGYPQMLLWVIPWDMIVLVGMNFAVAWFLFFRPVQGVFAKRSGVGSGLQLAATAGSAQNRRTRNTAAPPSSASCAGSSNTGSAPSRSIQAV